MNTKFLSLNSRLDKGDTVEFKHIGELTFSEEGKLLFVPSESLNYMTEAFGLASFVSPSVGRQAHQAVVHNLEATGAIALAPKTRKSAVYMKYAAIAVLALGLREVLLDLIYTLLKLNNKTV